MTNSGGAGVNADGTRARLVNGGLTRLEAPAAVLACGIIDNVMPGCFCLVVYLKPDAAEI